MASPPEIKKLESLLQKHLGDSKILKYTTKMLTAPGENYGSVILAVDVTLQNGQTSSLHLVAKLIPANEFLCEIFNIQTSFRREILMYTDVIPTICKFEESHGIREDKFSDLFAKCYGARISLNPDSDVVDKDAVLVLENLKILGYDTEDRLVGFDDGQIRVILKNLAVFHATPIAMRVLDPELFEKDIREYLAPVKVAELDEAMHQSILDDIRKTLSTCDKLIPYLNKIDEIITKNCDGTYRRVTDDGPFHTLVHTDFWTNNTMLLKDRAGKTIHNKIVDLQMPVLGPSVFDVLFVLFSSLSSDLLHEKLHEYIKFYHDQFIECLEKYKIDTKPFSFGEFQKQITKYGPLELGHILIMYKPILTVRGSIKDMSDFSPENFFKDIALHPDYTSRTIDSVVQFVENKWLVLE